MTAPLVDLEEIARELGITLEQAQAQAHIREALDAGFLRIGSESGDRITFAATWPDEVTQ